MLRRSFPNKQRQNPNEKADKQTHKNTIFNVWFNVSLYPHKRLNEQFYYETDDYSIPKVVHDSHQKLTQRTHKQTKLISQIKLYKSLQKTKQKRS